MLSNPPGTARRLWRLAAIIACPAAILWLGSDALFHINEAYDGLCPVQGPGFASLLYDGNSLGYCTGIGSYISVLGIIMGVAALLAPVALIGWWNYDGGRASD